MNDHGELIGADAVRFKRLLPGPIERVWRYLTEPEKRAKWLAGGDTELRVGGQVELHFHNAGLSSLPDIPPPEKYRDMPEKVSFSGKVTRCDPPRLLAHTWVGGDENEEGESEVTYELEERGDDVLLTLTHRRITTREMMSGICGGWHTHLDIMIDVLNAREPQPFWFRHTALEAEYETRLPQAG